MLVFWSSLVAVAQSLWSSLMSEYITRDVRADQKGSYIVFLQVLGRCDVYSSFSRTSFYHILVSYPNPNHLSFSQNVDRTARIAGAPLAGYIRQQVRIGLVGGRKPAWPLNH